MTAFPLACPQKHKIRNNNNKNDEKMFVHEQRDTTMEQSTLLRGTTDTI